MDPQQLAALLMGQGQPDTRGAEAAGRTLGAFGFSDQDAAGAAGKLAKGEADSANLTRLLQERYGFSPEDAAAFSGEMLGKQQGWDVYVPETAGKQEDPLIQYVTSHEYRQVPQAGRAAKAAVERAPTWTEASRPSDPHAERLARMTALRQKILGH